ncbi:MAG: TldD/PmbA family protein [Bryobacteraceae bacterium]
MISPGECRQMLAAAERHARSLGVRDVELIVSGDEESLTRFANNAIHQNVSERNVNISLRTQEDHRTARATTNRVDAASIQRAVDRAVALMRASAPDEALLPMAGPSSIEPVSRSAAATAQCGAAERAAQVRRAIAIAEEASQTAAGIFSISMQQATYLNSEGAFANHEETNGTFSITMMEADSSGWAKRSSVDVAQLDTEGLARSASRKAAMSRSPRVLDPGKYTVILEPAAVLDLVGQLFGDFSGTAIEDQRSFLTDRIGKQVFGANITIHDDARHPLQSGTPFDWEGVPRRKLTLVDSGVPREICYSRGAAARAGKEPTGHGLPLPNEVGEFPANIVIAGGGASVDEMVRSTERGILLTRVWYIREVEPYEKVMTGMTRDGTFLVEGGEIVCGIRNFRFNQSLVELLNQVEMLGELIRASGEETYDMVVPAMKVRDFHFTEVTKF